MALRSGLQKRLSNSLHLVAASEAESPVSKLDHIPGIRLLESPALPSFKPKMAPISLFNSRRLHEGPLSYPIFKITQITTALV